MADKFKVGIIGLGAIGTVHSNAYLAAGAEVAAICDIVPEKLESHGDRLKIASDKRFANYRDLLKSDIEGVSICVPNYLHMEMAIAALRAGKNVLLEKPMAMNAGQAARIVAEAEKAKGILQIGMVWRQSDDARLIKKYVEAGAFGDIYHVRAVLTRRRGIPGLGGWFTTKEQSGGGPLIDVGVHWFDMSMYTTGLWKPTSVSAMTYAKFGPRMENYNFIGMWAGPPKYDGKFNVEDYATGLVRFGNKATMNFEISWAANSEEAGYVEVLGDKGGARFAEDKPVVIRTEDRGNVADLAVTPRKDRTENFPREMAAFMAASRRKAKPAATGKEGLIVMKLIDAVYKSSQIGKEVAIK